ncbi:MAG: hypothetical protein QM811_26910 [Pirellulales bacterium]
MFLRKRYDYDALLLSINAQFDNHLAIVQIADPGKREQAAQQSWHATTQGLTQQLDPSEVLENDMLRFDRDAAMRDAFLLHVIPSPRSYLLHERTRPQQRDLADLAFALALYHRDHGRYPETLQKLVPGYVATIPLDRDAQSPLTYRTDGVGCLLYAFGENGADDNAEENTDDIAVYTPDFKPRASATFSSPPAAMFLSEGEPDGPEPPPNEPSTTESTPIDSAPTE